DRRQPAHQARDLDRERLVAVLGQAGGVLWHEGEAVELAAQRPGPGALGLGAGTACTRTLRSGAGKVGGGTAGVGAINTGTVGGPEQPHLRAMGEVLEPLGVSAAVVVEGVHAPALGHDPVQVDVGDGGARALWEALTLPQQVAAFVDEGL